MKTYLCNLFETWQKPRQLPWPYNQLSYQQQAQQHRIDTRNLIWWIGWIRWLHVALEIRFCGNQQFWIRNRRKVKNGFKVGLANGENKTQQGEGIVPINVPPTAAHVAVFDHMPNALLTAGPLVKAGCCIILNTPQAQVIDKKIDNIILPADFEPWSATCDVYLNHDRPIGNKQRRFQRQASNVYQIETKKDILNFITRPRDIQWRKLEFQQSK